MIKRLIAPALLSSLMLLGATASAQQAVPAQGPGFSQEQMDQLQQMQGMIGQMMQNMQDKGIDPAEFWGGLRQQMQDGTLDQAGIQQMLIDKGVLDKDMAAQMQTLQGKMQESAQKATLDNLKTQLAATDDEWKLLQPKIQKVLNCLAVLGQPYNGGGMMGFAGGQPAASNLSRALQTLRIALKDPASTADVIAGKLGDWRTAHEKAKTDLSDAQKDLVDLLLLRQEAILTNLGIL